MSNIAAETAQEIRRRLSAADWREVKSQQFMFPTNGEFAPIAIEVGYVLGECTVKFVPVDTRGAEGAMHGRGGGEIERGTGDDFTEGILFRAHQIMREATGE